MRGASHHRQSKAVTVAYAGIAAILLLIIVAVALVVVPPSPPQVAEFAPQAQEQIKDAPNQQSSQFGSGAGGVCAIGQVCEGRDSVAVTPPKRVLEKSRVRRCVGDPPRQTEDPQSPPCVNYWEGSNGGSTYKSVTRDEIRIGVPNWGYFGYGGENARYIDALFDHFNRRYVFYGRKLQRFNLSDADGSPESQRAIAATASENNVFASTDFLNTRYLHMEPFRRELARLGIISVAGDVEATSIETFRDLKPYAWSFAQPLGSLGNDIGRFACSSLAGRPARFAGPEFQTRTRKFAALDVRDRFAPPPREQLLTSMSQCGSTPAVFELKSGASEMATAAAQLRFEGFTTLIWLDNQVDGTYFMQGASQTGYQPEYIMGGGPEHYNEVNMSTNGPVDQRVHMFGLAPWNKTLAGSEEPVYWAVHDSDADFSALDAASTLGSLNRFYRELLLIASGIQLAGPRLTPETFARGLQSATFPNPGAGAPPYFQASVGFRADDYVMSDDVGVVSWSDSVRTPSDRQVGGWCYLDKGRRFASNRFVDVESKLFPLDTAACR